MEGVSPKWREIDYGPYSKIRRVEHTSHTVTQVGGKLYFLGGVIGREYLPIDDLFILDLEKSEWSSVEIPQGLTVSGRFSLRGHTATLIEDKILFIGGVLRFVRNLVLMEETSDVVLCFDAVLDEFSVVETFGDDKNRRICFHSADLLQATNEIIIYGEFEESNGANVHLLCSLNALSMTWRKVSWKGKAPPVRSSHATCLVGDQLYIFSGLAPDYSVKNDMHVLSFASTVPVFSEISVISAPRKRYATALFHYKGHLYMFGGKKQCEEGENIRLDDMHRFDLREQVWHECFEWRAGERPSPRCYYRGVHLGNRLLLFGGTQTSLLNALEISFE